MNPALAVCISFLAASLLLLQSASAEGKGDPDKGNEVFDEQCASCHHAYSTDRKVGPGLRGLFAKGRLESNGKPVNEANVIEAIENGGKGMPAFKGTLSDQDRSDLIAYLKTL
jgi:mono/diheme cytochrome c family protein